MSTSDLADIPAAATRIRIAGASYYLDAASALAALERYPYLREREVTAECGPVPLHMATHAFAVRWTAWSDGKILRGRVESYDQISQPIRLAAVEKLMGRVISASKHQQISPEMWMRWLDATGATAERIAHGVDERAVGRDQVATRVLELTEHTVRCADGTDNQVWVLRDQVHLPDRWNPPVRKIRKTGAMSATTWVFTDKEAARQALTDRDDHRLPVVTGPEAATELGTTPEALRKALSRAQLDDEPFYATVGRTNWYVLDHLAQWWRSRPGHGPGRGHISN